MSRTHLLLAATGVALAGAALGTHAYRSRGCLLCGGATAAAAEVPPPPERALVPAPAAPSAPTPSAGFAAPAP